MLESQHHIGLGTYFAVFFALMVLTQSISQMGSAVLIDWTPMSLHSTIFLVGAMTVLLGGVWAASGPKTAIG